MKVAHSHIFAVLKARGIFPLTKSEARYAEDVSEVILTKIGHPGVRRDSAIHRKVSELSLKFSKSARHHWKKGHKSKRRNGFFLKEMEVFRLSILFSL